MAGKGNLQLTGQMGDVMKESAQAAFTYIRSHATDLGIESNSFDKFDVHIHIPEGAIPKDGPSAGIAMTLALISAITKRPVKANIAMTGEITLRGRVLGIGGLKEKVLAAIRAGVKTVIFPRGNEKDLAEIPAYVRKRLNLMPVAHLDEVFAIAFKDQSEGTTRSRGSAVQRNGAKRSALRALKATRK
jgi:ATP-dependent Lon protease